MSKNLVAPPFDDTSVQTLLPKLKGVGTALQKDSDELLFWTDLLTTTQLSRKGDVEYLPVRGDMGPGKVLIHRKCYPHLISRIIYCWNHESRQCLVTGTPGIGKTIFGFFLIRHLWMNGMVMAIAYVFKQSLYLITNDRDIRSELGVSSTVSVFEGNTIDIHNNVLRKDKRITVVHDPEREATEPALVKAGSGPCRAFILSYGHRYRDYFEKKDEGPPLEAFFYTPRWSREEGHQCQPILKPFLDVDEAIEVFGGMVRKWMQPKEEASFEKLKKSLVDRIVALVKQYPRGDIQNHTEKGQWRGTLVQIEVYFDEKAKYWPSEELLSSLTEPDEKMEDVLSGDGGEEGYVEEIEVPTSENTTPNSFRDMAFYVGSPFILEQIMHASQNLGADHHSMFLAALKSEGWKLAGRERTAQGTDV